MHETTMHNEPDELQQQGPEAPVAALCRQCGEKSLTCPTAYQHCPLLERKDP